MSTLINAVCKFPPKQVSTRFGQKINAVFVLDSGEEHTAWALPSDGSLAVVAKGQKVQFMKENDKLKLVYSADKPADFEDDSTSAVVAQEDAAAFEANVSKYIKLYAYCLEQVKENINKELLDTDSIRSIATSIFIQAMKGAQL